MKKLLSYRPLQLGLGIAIGTLIYTGMLSAAREFDFARAVFAGMFCGTGAAVWQRFQRR